MIRSLLVSTLALAATIPLAGAQSAAPAGTASKPTAVTGVVRPVDVAPPSTCTTPSHTLECSDGAVFLSSTTVDLYAYVGQNVKAYGQTSAGCPVVDVESVETPPPVTLAICGTGGFGCPVRLRSGPGGPAQHLLLVSLGPGFVPLSQVKGSLLLGQPFFRIATVASTEAGPGVAFNFTIPSVPALAGVRLYFQTARAGLSVTTFDVPSPLGLSNAVCLDIVGLTIDCAQPDC